MKINKPQTNIPHGWNFYKLSDLLTVVVDNRGKTPPIQTSGIPMAEVNAIGDKNIEYSEITKFVSEETYKTWFRKHLEKNDILFSTVGRTASCSLYTAKIKTVIAQNLIGLRFGKDNPEFMFYLLTQDKNNQQFKNIEMNAAQPSVKVSQMIRLEFLLPPLPEQNRIVAVLETWDKAIEKLAEKIEIKKEIKKVLMQELLTAQKRLIGFKDKWANVKLADIAEIFSGGTPDTSNQDFWSGEINWITPTEITKTGKYIVLETEKKITGAGLKNCSAKLLPKNSLVICTRATVGECSISTYPICTNQGFKNLVPKKNTTVEYLYYFIKSIKSKLIKLGSGSTFLEVSKGDIEKLKLYLPPLTEQIAIANILTTADKEIAELEKNPLTFRRTKKISS